MININFLALLFLLSMAYGQSAFSHTEAVEVGFSETQYQDVDVNQDSNSLRLADSDKNFAKFLACREGQSEHCDDLGVRMCRPIQAERRRTIVNAGTGVRLRECKRVRGGWSPCYERTAMQQADVIAPTTQYGRIPRCLDMTM